MGRTFRGSNRSEGEIFRTRPDRPWGPPSLLYSGYRIFTREGKAAGAWRWPPTPSSAEVKERGELYLYSSSGTLWPIVGWTLPFATKYFIVVLVNHAKTLRENPIERTHSSECRYKEFNTVPHEYTVRDEVNDGEYQENSWRKSQAISISSVQHSCTKLKPVCTNHCTQTDTMIGLTTEN